MRCLLAPTKPRKSFDKFDPHTEYLIQLNVVKGLEKELGDRSPVLKLVREGRRVQHFRRWEDTLQLPVHLFRMDSLMELINDLVKIYPTKLSLKIVNLARRNSSSSLTS